MDAFFRETRDGRYVVALDIYPQLLMRTLDFLRCSPSTESINNAIRKWNAVELEQAAAAEGLVLAMIRTNEEFRREPQYTQVLSKMPLITVEKIGESDPVPLKASGNLPLSGIRAFGMGHVIAGAAMGRDMALYGADVLNIWRPRDSEVEAFAWDVQVGMRSTILDNSKEDRAQFNRLLRDADVFFANKRPGFLKKHDLDADALCQQKPGLIHATVVLHGENGPWSNRPGFDEIGATVSGLFTIEGSPTRPQQPPIVPICDNVVAWLGTTGILAALRRRAIEGGSYRVVVSLIFRDTAKVLKMTRYAVAWMATGCAMGAYETALKYAQERIQFGKPIASFQLVQDLLARMITNITASQCLIVRQAQLHAEGKLTDAHAALAKAFATAKCRETVAWARELLGGNGIVADYKAARFFADCEALYSYEGTYQMQNLIIGKAVTGLGAFV